MREKVLGAQQYAKVWQSVHQPVDYEWEAQELVAILRSFGIDLSSLSWLEVGCADGCLVQALSREISFSLLAGVDQNPLLLRSFQERFPQALTFCQDFSQPVEGKRFEVIHWGDSLPYIRDRDHLLQALDHLLGALQDEGFLLLAPTLSYELVQEDFFEPLKWKNSEGSWSFRIRGEWPTEPGWTRWDYDWSYLPHEGEDQDFTWQEKVAIMESSFWEECLQEALDRRKMLARIVSVEYCDQTAWVWSKSL